MITKRRQTREREKRKRREAGADAGLRETARAHSPRHGHGAEAAVIYHVTFHISLACIIVLDFSSDLQSDRRSLTRARARVALSRLRNTWFCRENAFKRSWVELASHDVVSAVVPLHHQQSRRWLLDNWVQVELNPKP